MLVFNSYNFLFICLQFYFQVFFPTLEEANNQVLWGKVVAVIHFARNFSSAYQVRRDNLLETEEQDLLASEIQIQLDMGGV